MAVTLWNKKNYAKFLCHSIIPAYRYAEISRDGIAAGSFWGSQFWVALEGNAEEQTCSAEEWIAIIYLEENVSVEIAFSNSTSSCCSFGKSSGRR